MPPRLRLQPKRLRLCTSNASYPSCRCRYASLATTPAAPVEQMIHAAPLISRSPPTQPTSHKPAEFRKTQLHRQYQSLLHSSPLMLLFQHNNLKATEWSGIRRELSAVLRKIDAELAANGTPSIVGESAKLQIVQTGIFASALKVVEYFQPDQSHSRTAGAADADPVLTHGLSRTAWEAARKNAKMELDLAPLLSGPLMAVTFPSVSPQHLKATLSILSPSENNPAPKRKANPSLYEPAVQTGLQKLMLLGARVEGKVFDTDGTRWVGSIEGGLDGLRGQLVAMLQSVGAGLTTTLEGAGKSLYLTMESRRTMLEDEQKGGDAKE
ncbi:hypothetical protein MBLNU459_g7009t1 [Dothideomycetes sp. NU459]